MDAVTKARQARWEQAEQVHKSEAEAFQMKMQRRRQYWQDNPRPEIDQTEVSSLPTKTQSGSEACPTCLDLGAVTKNVPIHHPDFGKSFPCPTCLGPKLAQQRLDTLIASSGLSKHHQFTFEQFWALPDEWREGKEHVAELCQIFATERQLCIEGICKRGVLLEGSFGVGKTTLATSTLIEAARIGSPILCVKFADFLDDVQDTYGRERNDGPSADDIIRAAQRAGFVLLDDMGDPTSSAEMSSDKRRIAHKLLEYRLEHELPTIITTNCTTEQLSKQLTEKTKQRVTELCHWIKVRGKSLRTEG
jgi:DNA replication protein DnaC